MTSKSPENIAFIGREGSGKSTQAHELATYLNKPYISTGDILRDLAKNDSGIWGNACRDMFEKSVYLDGQMLIDILVDRLSKDDCQDGFILDGGLRTLKETVIFKDMLVSAGRDYPLTVIHLRLPGWQSIDRLVTGESARGRSDDTIEAVLARLSKYQDKLVERINVIKSTNGWQILNINAQPEQQVVLCDILQRISPKNLET